MTTQQMNSKPEPTSTDPKDWTINCLDCNREIKIPIGGFWPREPRCYDCMKPSLLDLFCGAGGCTKGYQRAGFHVVGVDSKPQPNYCGDEFHQTDALTFPLEGFDAIHASPPCQAFSTLAAMPNARQHPNLIEPTRERLDASGLPYVIENVVGSPLHDAVTLCGSMFGLGANDRQLRRHRLFECHGFTVLIPQCQHRGQPVGVYGTGGGGQMTRGYKGTPQEYRDALGIDWMNRRELAQAIPPAYTEHVGGFLMNAIKDHQ